jgi:hypothetical protein
MKYEEAVSVIEKHNTREDLGCCFLGSCNNLQKAHLIRDMHEFAGVDDWEVAFPRRPEEGGWGSGACI